jgi:hypothetical protein
MKLYNSQYSRPLIRFSPNADTPTRRYADTFPQAPIRFS